MSDHIRYTREQIDAMFARGEIRPFHVGLEPGYKPPSDVTPARFVDPDKRVLRAKAAAASRRRAAALRALKGGGHATE